MAELSFSRSHESPRGTSPNKRRETPRNLATIIATHLSDLEALSSEGATSSCSTSARGGGPGSSSGTASACSSAGVIRGPAARAVSGPPAVLPRAVCKPPPRRCGSPPDRAALALSSADRRLRPVPLHRHPPASNGATEQHVLQSAARSRKACPRAPSSGCRGPCASTGKVQAVGSWLDDTALNFSKTGEMPGDTLNGDRQAIAGGDEEHAARLRSASSGSSVLRTEASLDAAQLVAKAEAADVERMNARAHVAHLRAAIKVSEQELQQMGMSFHHLASEWHTHWDAARLQHESEALELRRALKHQEAMCARLHDRREEAITRSMSLQQGAENLYAEFASEIGDALALIQLRSRDQTAEEDHSAACCGNEDARREAAELRAQCVDLMRALREAAEE